jgi:hypothetical protein
MPADEWTTAEHVDHYLGRADEYPRRAGRGSVLLIGFKPGRKAAYT